MTEKAKNQGRISSDEESSENHSPESEKARQLTLFFVQYQETGNERYLEKVMKGSRSTLSSLLYKRNITSPDEREELFQSTFMRAIQNRESYDPELCSITSWLYRIMSNLVIDQVRTAGRMKNRPFRQFRNPRDEDDNKPTDDFGIDIGNTDDTVVLREITEQVLSAIPFLEEIYQRIIYLHVIEERDRLEISQILEIPYGTVKSRLHRGQIALRKLLPNLEEEFRENHRSLN